MISGTWGPAPETPVEYDSIATLGVTPKAAAVSALVTAMRASSSALGSTFTAQSPYTNTCTHTQHTFAQHAHIMHLNVQHYSFVLQRAEECSSSMAAKLQSQQRRKV